MQPKIVRGADIENKPGFVVDPEDGKPNLVDVDKMIGYITEILTECNKEENLNLQRSNKEKYEQVMEEKFQDFALQYYSIFRKVISGESLDTLFYFLEHITMIKQGETTLDNAEKKLGEELAEEHIYSKFGGKHNFEKAMKKQQKNKKR